MAGSEEYDNFVGKTNIEKNILSDLLESDTPKNTNTNGRDVHWKEMPEFVQNAIKTYKTLYVHFRNEEDYLEFQKLIGQTLTKKTKATWHPLLEKNELTLDRWID